MIRDQQTLEELRAACEEQLRRYQKLQDPDTTACAEILRRAVAHNEPALNVLLGITAAMMLPRCPRRLAHYGEDWSQDILTNVSIKLQNRRNPYVIKLPPPAPMAAYRAYVQMVARSVTYDYDRRAQRQQGVSLDELHRLAGFEPADGRPATTEVHQRMRMDRLLELIAHPLDREIFRLRFVLQLKPEEIVTTLADQFFSGTPVTKERVSRSLERTIVSLSKIPEVRELFEGDDEV